jgi:putative transposase
MIKLKSLIDNSDLSAKEAATYENISDKMVRNRCKNGFYAGVRVVKSNGGRQYRIPISSLSLAAQKKHFQHPDAEDQAKETKSSSRMSIEEELDFIQSLPSFQRKHINLLLPHVRAVENLTWKQRQAYRLNHNMEHTEKSERLPGKSQFDEWVKKYKKKHDVRDLCKGYGQSRSKITDEWFKIYTAQRLNEQGPSAYQCWNRTRGILMKKDSDFDPETLPLFQSFERRFKKEYCPQERSLARLGPAKTDRIFGAYIDRNYKNLQSNAWWVADNHTIDIETDYNGQIGRPNVTVIQDMRSGLIVAHNLHFESSRSDHIMAAIADGIAEFGKPNGVLFDHGKDFVCKSITAEQRGLLCNLQIELKLAIVKNAKTKSVERWFKTLIDTLVKGCDGYTGGSVANRPERLKQTEKLNKLPTYEEIEEALPEYIKVYNHTRMTNKRLKNETPAEVFDRTRIPKISISHDALSQCFLKIGPDRSVGRNGIEDTYRGVKRIYYSPELVKYKGTHIKFYLTRDNKFLDEAFVYCSDNHNFICKAFAKPEINAIEEDSEKLACAIQVNSQENKRIRDRIKTGPALSITDTVKVLRLSAEADGGFKQMETENPPATLIQLTKHDYTLAEVKRQELEYTQNFSNSMPEPQKKEQRKLKFVPDGEEDIYGQNPSPQSYDLFKGGIDRDEYDHQQSIQGG